jgi:hypothetical protein
MCCTRRPSSGQCTKAVLPSGMQPSDVLRSVLHVGRRRLDSVGESRHRLPQPSEELVDRTVDDLLECPSVGEGHRKQELPPSSCRGSIPDRLGRLSPRGASATAWRFVRHASTLSTGLRLG